jgi:hypothetical protein
VADRNIDAARETLISIASAFELCSTPAGVTNLPAIPPEGFHKTVN